MITLLDECVKAIEKDAKLFYGREDQKICAVFDNIFPLTRWGRIDWQKVPISTEIFTAQDIVDQLKKNFVNFDSSIYILWNEGSLSAIKSDLVLVLNNIDEVTPVSFDPWLFCPTSKYVIEFYHEGEVTFGITPGPGPHVQLKNLYDIFSETNIEISSFAKEYHDVIAEIIAVGKNIAVLTEKILTDEKLTDDEITVLEKEYLTKSAWRVSHGNPYPLIKIPAVLEYARKIKELQKSCDGVILYEEVLTF